MLSFKSLNTHIVAVSKSATSSTSVSYGLFLLAAFPSNYSVFLLKRYQVKLRTEEMVLEV